MILKNLINLLNTRCNFQIINEDLLLNEDVLLKRTKKISTSIFINYLNDKSRYIRQNSINKNPVKEKYKEYFN